MRSLHGNIQGLKPNQLRRIEKLYQRRVSPNQIVTPEFARQLSELSHETRRQIGALIDRKGYVEFVIVGDARRIELPDFKRVRVAGDRFRGLRCVHTHLRGEELTRDDLTDLALLRLDLMAAIERFWSTSRKGQWLTLRIQWLSCANWRNRPAWPSSTQ